MAMTHPRKKYLDVYLSGAGEGISFETEQNLKFEKYSINNDLYARVLGAVMRRL